MLMREFEEDPKQRRARLVNKRTVKATNLNLRIKHFITNIDRDVTLNESEKKRIKRELFKGIELC